MASPLRFRRAYDPVLVVVDAASAVLVAWVAYRLRFEGLLPLAPSYEHRYRATTVGLAVTWVLLARNTGLYRRGAVRPGTSNLEPAFSAALASGLALLVANYAALGGKVSRAWIGLVVLGLVLAGVGSRGVLRRTRRLAVPLGWGLERYGVLGDDAAARRIEKDLTRAPGAPFRVVGSVPDGLQGQDLLQEVRRLRLDGLVLPAGRLDLAGSLAPTFAGTGIDLLVAPQLGELESRVARITVLHGVPLLHVAGLTPSRGAQRVRARDRGRHGVAVLGTRGIPANYGGFETFAQEVAVRFVERGLPTTVYGRSHYVTERGSWRGVRLVVLPTIRSKHLDTVVHTALSSLHLVLTRGPRDVILCNAANAPVLLLLRLFRRRVVVNVDGLEWRRSKWGIAGRSWYRLGEWLSVRLASVLVTDADEVQTYYRVRHDSDSVMIPYGARQLERGSHPVPRETPVAPDRYVLYVSRWERENNPVLVAAAHAEAATGLDLVMLGQVTYDDGLAAEVRSAAGPRTHLPGALFGEPYLGLQANARCYVHATEVGGTHPALIEAMGSGNLVLVLDTPENREVAGPAGVFFHDQPSLVAALRWVAQLSEPELAGYRRTAREHVARRYSWDAVTRSYLDLLGRP